MGTHFFTIQSHSLGRLHTVEVTGSNPVLPTSSRSGPVSRTGVIPEEPVVTQVVTAGSGVSCGCARTFERQCLPQPADGLHRSGGDPTPDAAAEAGRTNPLTTAIASVSDRGTVSSFVRPR
jgi:hypothetical protein